MKIHLSELIDRHWLTPRLKNEARKLRLTIYIEFENEFSQTVLMLYNHRVDEFNSKSQIINDIDRRF